MPCAGVLIVSPLSAPATAVAVALYRRQRRWLVRPLSTRPPCNAWRSVLHCPLSISSTAAPASGGFMLLLSRRTLRGAWRRLRAASFDALASWCLAACPALVFSHPLNAAPAERRLRSAPCVAWRRVLRSCPHHQLPLRRSGGSHCCSHAPASRCLPARPALVPSPSAHQPLSGGGNSVLLLSTRPPCTAWRRILHCCPQHQLPLRRSGGFYYRFQRITLQCLAACPRLVFPQHRPPAAPAVAAASCSSLHEPASPAGRCVLRSGPAPQPLRR